MNLVILVGRFPPGALGGAEHQAECWAKLLSDRHRVCVITRREDAGPVLRESRDGFEIVRLPVSRIPLWRAFADASAIARAVTGRAPRPDALLCFQTFVSGFAGTRIQRATGIPALVWIRGEGEYQFAQSAQARLMNPSIWKEARAVLIQTDEGRAAFLHQLEQRAPALRAAIERKLVVVPNGLDLPPASALGPLSHGARVLSVGRLIHDKGMDTMIDAMASAGGGLTLAGAGPERDALEARAKARGADVRFTGFLDRAALASHYRDARCVVLAARRGEGLPNVVLEAMAWGRPVIATPVAGVKGLVRHETNGLIVPPGDPAALTAAIRRLDADPALADRLGAEARRTAEAFAWESVRPRLEDVLERVIR